MKCEHGNHWNLLLHRRKDRIRRGTHVLMESTCLGGLHGDSWGGDLPQEGGYCNGRPWDCPKSAHWRPQGKLLHKGRNCWQAKSRRNSPLLKILYKEHNFYVTRQKYRLPNLGPGRPKGVITVKAGLLLECWPSLWQKAVQPLGMKIKFQ